LSRYTEDVAITTDYIVVEMARYLLGPNWQEEYLMMVNDGGIERVLL